MSYDSWLVAEHERREAEWEALVAFCEREDLDPYDDESAELYERELEAQAEDAAERVYEARREAREEW